MINNRISVTDSITGERLEGISAKGYDFYWSKPANGYELRSPQDLVFDMDLYNETHSSQNAAYPKRFSYDRDKLLMYPGITLPTYHFEPPILDIDTQPPWLVEKGSLELAQKFALTHPGPLDYDQLSKRLVPTTEYQPLSDHALHRKFAYLKTNPDGIIKFANKYGRLGRQVMLRSPEDNLIPDSFKALYPDAYPPQRFRWNLPDGELAFVHGESLVRWSAEIELMGVLLSFWDIARNETAAGKLGRFIQWSNNGSVTIRFKWQRAVTGEYEISAWDGNQKKDKSSGFGYHDSILASPRFSPEFFTAYTRGDVTGPAFVFVATKINLHLADVTPRLIGWYKDKVEITYIPRTLLDALWLLFMLEVQGKTQMERCKFCSNWFDYQRHTKSYCCDRHRVYAHRTKHKQEAINERASIQEKRD